MINEEIKNKYLEMVDSLGIKDNILNSLKDFIKSYDGSGSPEFHQLMLEIINMVINTNDLKAKGEVFDEMEKTIEANDERLSKKAAALSAKEDYFNTPLPTES